MTQMPRREVPAAWLPAMSKHGMTSFRDVAKKANMHADRVIRVMTGGSVKPDAIAAVAAALGLSVEHVMSLRGDTATTRFELPAEADSLTERERRAIREMINVLLAAKASAAPAQPETPTRAPVVSPEPAPEPRQRDHALVQRVVKGGSVQKQRERLEPPAGEESQDTGSEDGA